MDGLDIFLSRAKEIVQERGVIFVDREQSRKFMRERDLTIQNIEHLILNLKRSDCFDGPEADRDDRYKDAWTVAEFRPYLSNEQLYLKISISIVHERCKCLSIKLYEVRR